MTNYKSKILLLEPSRIVAEGLCKILNDSGLFGQMSHLSSIVHLGDYLQSIHPDVLIINPQLVAAEKITDIFSLLQHYPSLKILAFCTQLADSALLQRFHATASIYTNPSHLVKTLRELTEQPVLPAKSKSEKSDALSKREIEILILVAQGLMNKEIADRLNISLNTVITHRKNIIKKTGIKSVAGLTSYALMHNYINIGK